MAQHKINKRSNGYADSIDSAVYAAIPKAVWAAIAISLASCGGERLDDATRAIVREWSILHDNGIVPQAVPGFLRGYDREDA